jgi:hypothetical protein
MTRPSRLLQLIRPSPRRSVYATRADSLMGGALPTANSRRPQGIQWLFQQIPLHSHGSGGVRALRPRPLSIPSASDNPRRNGSNSTILERACPHTGSTPTSHSRGWSHYSPNRHRPPVLFTAGYPLRGLAGHTADWRCRGAPGWGSGSPRLSLPVPLLASLVISARICRGFAEERSSAQWEGQLGDSHDGNSCSAGGLRDLFMDFGYQ